MDLKVRQETKEVMGTKIQEVKNDNIYVRKVHNISSGYEYLVFEVLKNGRIYETEEIPIVSINAGIIELKNKDSRIDRSDISIIKKFIRDNMEIIPSFIDYDGLGYDYLDGKTTGLFKGSEIIGIEGELNNSSKHLKKRGSKEGFRKNFNKYIKGKDKAETVVAFSLAAAIIGGLGKDSRLLILSGETSTGKTSISDFAASTWSSPKDTKIRFTWNGTDKSLVKKLDNNHGVGVYIDDMSTREGKDTDITSLIYDISSSVGRSKLIKADELNKETFFNTTVTISSEIDVLSNCNFRKKGVLPRALQLNIEPDELTESAEEAREIQEAAKENYGVAGMEIARLIINQNMLHGELQMMYNKEVEELNSYSGTNIAERVNETIAAVIVAAKLAKVVLGIDFNYEGIRDCLIEANTQNIEDFEIREKRALISSFATKKYEEQLYKDGQNYLKDTLYKEFCEYAKKQNVFVKDGYYNMKSDELRKFALINNLTVKDIKDAFFAEGYARKNGGKVRKDFSIKSDNGKPIVKPLRYFSVLCEKKEE